MLQHNAADAPSTPKATLAARRAHAAHAAVVGSHLLCCGAPAALMLFAAGAGASVGLTAVQRFFNETHAYLHTHELWILALSAAFVLLGGWLEWRAHRGRRLSLFFAASLACFALNAGVIVTHQGAHVEAYSVEAAAR